MKSNELDSDSPIYRLRHSASHVLAMAMKEFDPKVKFAIGPPIENGFYYDFEFSKPFTEADLKTIEGTMKKIINQNLSFEHKTLAAKKAIEQEKADNQNFKVELIQDLGEKEVSYYGIGDFWDLCKGPHAKSTGEIKAFKLLSTAGAYWRGDEKKPMLTRIYGTAFETEKELNEYLKQLEEAKLYDHRKLGKDLGIFKILPEIGSGLPVFLPKGATLYRLIADYLMELEIEHGYQHVISSVLGKKELYQTSGHLEHYSESMYPPIKIENEEFILRPMNCPHHISLFRSELHSYRELPVRLAEFGTVYRYEKSGELTGLQRTRGFAINDAHIFCRINQIETEIKDVITLIQTIFKKFGLKDHWFRLSLRGKGHKYAESDQWNQAEKMLKDALKTAKVDYVEAEDEAAFYGPKIDVQMCNPQGREETISTIQLDFYLPERFKLEFVNDKGQKETPVIIHRAAIGSMERFIGHLLEQTKGDLPIWLSPVQVKIIPVTEKISDYAQEVKQALEKAEIRSELAQSDQSLNRLIREAELEKVPMMVIVGEKEKLAKKVTLRTRSAEKQVTITVPELIKLITPSLN